MTNTPVTAREILDQQWIQAVKVATGLSPIRVPQEYEETKTLLDLLDRKLKAIQSIATVINKRGDDYTVNTFEGSLLGGLNDYQIDIDFHNSPTTRMNVAGAVLQRLTLIRRFLTLAFDYFRIDGEDSPLYQSFVESVYPSFMDWVHVQSENLTAS